MLPVVLVIETDTGVVTAAGVDVAEVFEELCVLEAPPLIVGCTGPATNRWLDVHRGLDGDLGLDDDDRRVGDGLVDTGIPPMPLCPSVIARVLLVMGRRSRGGGRRRI